MRHKSQPSAGVSGSRLRVKLIREDRWNARRKPASTWGPPWVSDLSSRCSAAPLLRLPPRHQLGVRVRTQPGNWNQSAVLTGSEGAADECFGYSVAAEDDTPVIGPIASEAGRLMNAAPPLSEFSRWTAGACNSVARRARKAFSDNTL